MLRLLEWSIANALTVLLLMPIVFAVGRVCRQPAVRHGLWILLLVKLVTPPMIPVSWDPSLLLLATTSPAPLAERPIVRPEVGPVAEASFKASRSDVKFPPTLTESAAWDQGTELRSRQADTETTAAAWVRGAIAPLHAVHWDVWGSRLLCVWGAVSVSILLIQVRRLVLFSLCLRRAAQPSELLSAQVSELREALGCASGPRALLVDGVVSPMLWGVGPWATILFPRELFRTLDPQSRSTLLLHEMAHYYRGDHWVRLLEFGTTTLFWWHPTVWWSLREIEAAEEQCCDHWVMQRTPHSPRCYADALLDTIDFLCERQRSLPPVASGLGNPRELRGRLVRIMRHTEGSTINVVGRLLLASVVCLLPLQLRALDAFSRRISGTFRESPATTVATVDPGMSASSAQRAVPILVDHFADVPPTAPVRQIPAAPADMAADDFPVAASDWATAISLDRRYQIVAKTGRRVELHDLDRDRVTPLEEWNIVAAAFIPGQDRFVTGGFDGTVRLWDATTGQLVSVIGETGDAVATIATSANGRWIASGSRDGRLALYEISSNHLIGEWALGEPLSCVRFSPDGAQLLATTGHWRSEDSGRLFVLTFPSLQLEAPRVIGSNAGAINFTSDPAVVVLGSWDGKATYVRLADGARLAQVATFKDWISASAFSPDTATFAPLSLAEARFEEQRLARVAAERAAAAQLAAQRAYMLFNSYLTAPQPLSE